MSEPNVALAGMLVGRIEVLERAMLRVMALVISRDPEPDELLEELRSDLRSFVLSLPMTPEEIQNHARQSSDELLQQISGVLQGSAHSPDD